MHEHADQVVPVFLVVDDVVVERLWTRFRESPRALQVLGWLALWPFLLSLKLVAGNRYRAVRWILALALAGLVGSAWVVSWVETLSGRSIATEVPLSADLDGESTLAATENETSSEIVKAEEPQRESGSGDDLGPTVTTVAATTTTEVPVSTTVVVTDTTEVTVSSPSVSIAIVAQSCDYHPLVTVSVLNTGRDVVSGGVFVPVDLGEGGYVPLFGSFLSLDTGDATEIDLTSLDDCGEVLEVGVPSAARLFTPGYRPEPLPNPAVEWTDLSIVCDRSIDAYEGRGLVENLTDEVVTGGFFLVVKHSDYSAGDRLGAVVERLAPGERREVTFGFEVPCRAEVFELNVETAFAF